MRIGIVGAGVIGVTAAHALMREGHDVFILDPAGIANGASSGNAGAFAFSDIIPLATPGILRQAPKWLMDPLGPLSIRPSYAPHLLSWLLKFFRASLPGRYTAAINAQAALMLHARTALDRLLPATQAESLIRREGQLQIYDSAQAFAASRPGWDARKQAGFRFEVLDSAQAIADIQPGIAPHFSHAVFTPDWINTTDPKHWVEHIAQDAVRNGVTILPRRVEAIRADADRARLETDDGQMIFDRVVLAAGAHSNRLLRPLNLSLPLETERGYNTTLPECAFDLRTHVTFSNHGFVVTRIGTGLRVGGAVELGGLDLPPNMKRAEALLAKAKRFLPDLDATGGTQWMGLRPSMPDSLPVIGNAPGHPSLVLAFGHGHLGLTQSAGTAELVADLVAGRPSSIDITPYRPGRFLRGQP